jgi:HK97 gp10 family phage protein
MAVIRSASEFRAAMKRREDAVLKAGITGLAEATRHIAEEVRELAPKDTGELADTIQPSPVVVSGDRISAEVVIGAGLDSPHVASVEYGNVNQAANPFIRPGFRRARDGAREIIADHLTDALT